MQKTEIKSGLPTVTADSAPLEPQVQPPALMMFDAAESATSERIFFWIKMGVISELVANDFLVTLVLCSNNVLHIMQVISQEPGNRQAAVRLV